MCVLFNKSKIYVLIVRFIKSRRKTWLGHVMWMDGGRWVEDVEEDIETMGIRGLRKLNKERTNGRKSPRRLNP